MLKTQLIVAKTMFLNNAHRTLHHSCIRGMLIRQRRSDIRVSFGVSSGRVCIILYGYNGARDEKTKWRRRKFPSGISPE